MESIPLWSWPLWVIFPMLAVVLIGGHEVGVQIRRRLARGKPTGEGEGGARGYLGGALGLLALLIAFTFSMAAARYDHRRQLVEQEADALRATYVRIQALDEPDRTRLSRSLLRYIEAREAFSRARDPARVTAAEAQTQVQLLDGFWPNVQQAIKTKPGPLTFGLIDKVTDLANVAAARRTAIEAHVPAPVLRILLLYAVLCAVFMGYDIPPGRRFLLASTVQLTLLALAITLVVDLDRPVSNLGMVSQTPVIRLGDTITRLEAEKAAAAAKAPPAGIAPAGRP